MTDSFDVKNVCGREIIMEENKTRLLVVSDTHGRTKNLEKVLARVSPIDYLLHLGDVGIDTYAIERLVNCPCCFVAGNNDFFSSLPKERVVKICGQTIFMTHGHNYYVSSQKGLLCRVAAEQGATIALFGHTHIPYLEEMNGLMLANPGSISLPRQADHLPSYLLITLSGDGNVLYEPCVLQM